MKVFIETFKRVALKYAEYIETKLIFSANIVTPMGPGQEIFLEEPNDTAEEYIKEIQTLCQITETLQNLKTDVFGIDEEEPDNLQQTDAVSDKERILSNQTEELKNENKRLRELLESIPKPKDCSHCKHYKRVYGRNERDYGTEFCYDFCTIPEQKRKGEKHSIPENMCLCFEER